MASVVKVGDGGASQQATMHMFCDEEKLSESQQKVYGEWSERVREYNMLMKKHKEEEEKYQKAIRAVDTRVGLKDSDQIQNGPTKFLRSVPASVSQVSNQLSSSTVSSSSVQTQQTKQTSTVIGNTLPSRPSIGPAVSRPGVSSGAITLNGRQQLAHGGVQLSVRQAPTMSGKQLLVRATSSASMPGVRTMLQTTAPQQQSSVTPAVVRPGTYLIQNGFSHLEPKKPAPLLPKAANHEPVRLTNQNILNVSQRPKAGNDVDRGVKRPLESSTPAGGNKQAKHSLDTKKLMMYYPFKKGKTIPSEERRFKIKCFHCSETMASNVQYATHVKKIVESLWPDVSKLTVCPRCFKRFRVPAELQEHLKIAHVKGATYQCFTCDLSFASNVALMNHMNMFHAAAQMPFYCQICEYRTSAYSDIIEHFSLKHVGYKALMCPYCLKMLRCSKTFLQHCQKHIQMSIRLTHCTFACKNCKLSFLSTAERSEHVQRDHKRYEVHDRDGVPRYVRDTLKSLEIMVSAGITIVRDSSKVSLVSKGPYTFNQQASLNKKLACMECGLLFNNFGNHFTAKLNCDKCAYSTFCPRSLATHMILFHKAGKPPPKVHAVKKKTNADGTIFLTCKVCNYQTKAPTHMAHHCAKKCVQKTPMEWMSYLYLPPTKKAVPSNLVDVIVLDDD